MSEILFFSEDTIYEPRNKNKRKEWIRQTIVAESKTPGAINLILCSDEYLLRINADYLNHDYYTDIITFDNSLSDQSIDGDLFISIDRVKENANNLQIEHNDELDRVIIHGILHLIGYNDKTDEDIQLMREKEEAYLSLRNH